MTGEEAARAWAQWHLGSPQWASDILWAFHHPDEAMAVLEQEKAGGLGADG